MNTQLKVNTAQIVQSATDIEKLNDLCQKALEADKSAMNTLANSWEGKASNETMNLFNKRFVKKHYDNASTLISQYTAFLFQDVAQCYEEAENINIEDSVNLYCEMFD
jgi:uncharacterized protein YukE